jgi:hypothetical protein
VQSIEWLPVVGFEGFYEVSDDGRVRSLSRSVASVNGSRRVRGRELAHKRAGKYLGVTLSVLGVHTSCYIHRLVAAAFLGQPERRQEVRHLDGNGTNNDRRNLSWGTHSENALDMVGHGTHRNAKKTHCMRGHEFTTDNIYWFGTRRRCVTCTKMHAANRVKKRP